MIAVDTSALMAIVLDEPQAAACVAALEAEQQIVISAATVAESLIVAAHRNVGEGMSRIVDGLGFTVVPVTAAAARRVAAAYARWGKGNHGAGLNFGDCLTYAVARLAERPLLFVGDDFSRTDLTSA